VALVLPLWACLSAGAGASAQVAPAGGPAEDDFSREANYDELILSLAKQFTKSQTEARDAAVKLGQIGRRAAPVLTELLQRGPNDQVKYCAALALSRMRHPSGALALLPVLSDPKASREMRLLALDAAAGCSLEQAVGPLKKIGAGEPDAEMRLKALQALSVMPNAWKDCEALFAAGLDDPREEIRSLAAQVCLYAAAVKVVYGASEPALLSHAESDPSLAVRARCVGALAKMKSGRAIPVFLRIAAQPVSSSQAVKQILLACETIAGVPFRDVAALTTWWEKHGKARYEKAPPLQPATLTKDVPGPAKPEPPAASGSTSAPPATGVSAKTDPPAKVEPRAPALDAGAKTEPPAAEAPVMTGVPARVVRAPGGGTGERTEEPGERPRLVIPDEDPPPKPYSGVPMGG
jgi:HEAT repeat protein